MNQVAATDFIAQTFDSKFDDTSFESFVANLLNNVDRSKAIGYRSGKMIAQKFRGHISTYRRPFVYYDPNGDRLDVLIVRLSKESNLERARTMQRNFAADYLKKASNETIEAALIAFYHEDVDDWRFSLVKLEYAFGDEGLEERLTPARRYSFLVGPTEPTHTAEEQLRPFLVEDGENPTIESLVAAFQIETVSKKFFEEYKGLFVELVEGVDAIIKADKMLAADFARADIYVPNFSKKLLGQIVFLYFVQKKGWLGVGASVNKKWGDGPKDFLRRLFDKTDGVAYDNFFNNILEPLFYAALAVYREDDLFTIGGYGCKIPFLNGGLFEPMGGYDWEHTKLLLPNSLFSNRQDAEDDAGTGILDIFDRYNFTVWEEEPLEKEVAVDPEMLGKVFENLLEVQDRKSKGAFYTPREIVHYMCQESLINYLDTAVGAGAQRSEGEKGAVSREEIGVLVRQGALALQHDAAKEAGLKKDDYILPASVRGHAAALDAALENIKICDPAIGSGAFPVGMLHEIVQARLALATYLSKQVTGTSSELGSPVPVTLARTPYQLKRHAIQESIYGVDIDEGAVEIAKLRLWLSLVVDEQSYDNIQPLPNLDYKIVRGNSLLGVEKNLFNAHLFVNLDKLKRDFFDETHRQEKLKLKAQIDQLIDLLTDGNSTFDFEVYFHEVFAEQGGFDVVIGNPPYVRHERIKEQKPALKKMHPAVYQGTADLYVYFYSQGMKVLSPNGFLVFITGNKFMRAGYGKKLRQFLATKTTPQILIDFGDLPVFDASAYPCIVITKNAPAPSNNVVSALTVQTVPQIEQITAVMAREAWPMPQHKALTTDGWRLESPEVLNLLDKLRNVGTPLGEYVNGRFYYGIKTGYNEAFVIDRAVRDRLIAEHASSAEIIKPFLRGKDVKRWQVHFADQYLIKLESSANKKHPWSGQPEKAAEAIFARTYPAIHAHFEQYRDRLQKRYDQGQYFWELRACAYWEEFDNPKIILGRFMNKSTFSYDPAAFLHNDALYMIAGVNEYVVSVLNSSIGWWFLTKICTDLQNGYLQAFRENLFDVPIAEAGEEQQASINLLVQQIMALLQDDPNADVSQLEQQIDQFVYQLYGLSEEELAIVVGVTNE